MKQTVRQTAVHMGRRICTRAFTLIELLVVIGVIAVLAAIGLTVAVTVLDSGRAQATQSTILALESVVQDLSLEAGLSPKDYKTYEVVDGAQTVQLPIIDARLEGSSVDAGNRAEPSLARLLKVAQETVPGVASRWQQLDASLLQESQIGFSAGGNGTIGTVRVTGTEVLDQWGNPIRFVHPSFDGGGGNWFAIDGMESTRNPIANVAAGQGTGEEDFRRSFRPFDPSGPVADAPNPIGDADEGIVPGGTSGYLYSAGPDGDPGTRADNVYGSVEPEYPSETVGQD